MVDMVDMVLGNFSLSPVPVKSLKTMLTMLTMHEARRLQPERDAAVRCKRIVRPMSLHKQRINISTVAANGPGRLEHSLEAVLAANPDASRSTKFGHPSALAYIESQMSAHSNIASHCC